jgi:hypothetical protein
LRSCPIYDYINVISETILLTAKPHNTAPANDGQIKTSCAIFQMVGDSLSLAVVPVDGRADGRWLK